MAAVYTFGLAEILVADVLETGLMPATADMVKIGEVLQDSASLTQEEGDKTEIFEQSNPIPKVVIEQAGTTTIAFNLMNVDPAMLGEYIGGAVNATSKEWEFDGKKKSVNKALFIKPEQGIYFKLPKASMSAVIAGDLNQSGLLTLNFTVTPLSPGDGLKSILAGLVSDLPPEGWREINLKFVSVKDLIYQVSEKDKEELGGSNKDFEINFNLKFQEDYSKVCVYVLGKNQSDEGVLINYKVFDVSQKSVTNKIDFNINISDYKDIYCVVYDELTDLRIDSFDVSEMNFSAK